MSTLNRVKRLYVRSNYSFEHTSYLNSYCRSLPEWSHYQSQHAESKFTPESLRLDSGRVGRGGVDRGVTSFAAIGKLIARLRRGTAVNLWKRCATALTMELTATDQSAQLAEQSAQSCLAGLSRFTESAGARMELKPQTDRAAVRLLEFRFQPPMLTAGSAT